MKREFFILIVLIFVSDHLFSQDSIQKKPLSVSSQMQFEIFGPAGLGSFNFESRFFSPRVRIKVGAGITPLNLLGESCNSGGIIMFPVGIHYLIGKKNHFLETGGGVVFPLIPGITKVYCPDIKPTFFGEDIGIFNYLLIGYRYLPGNKRKTSFRIFFCPLFQSDFPVKYWGGASVGYSFKTK
jgi:hypothetical protein